MAIIPEGDEKFYDEQGNLPQQIQDDLERISSEGSVPANPNDYEISGGSGNWTITWSDGTTANTTVRNPLSAANDARLLANAFEARQGSTTTATRTASNGVPAWVDSDYGYDVNNPRKPNMREMMELIAGKTVEELYASGEDYSDITRLASDLLYGSVGSNQDTRDFIAITNAATDPNTGQLDAKKFVAATQIATSQMYGGTTVKYMSGGYQTDEAGNTIIGSDGKPVSLPPMGYIVGGNGTILRGFTVNNVDNMTQQLTTFGVQTVDWVGDFMNAMQQSGSFNQTQMQANLKALGDLQNSYNPWGDYQDIWGMEGLITGVAPMIDNFQIVSGQTLSGTATGTETTQTGTSATQVTGDQTQTQPPTETTQTFEKPPEAVSYQMPTGYQGSGFVPTYMNQEGTGVQTPTMAPTTGTFTKPTTGIIGLQPTQTYQINQPVTPMPQPVQPQQYDVRMYRNNAGMTVSITFVNGQPQTPIPSGFYPVDQQPAGQMPFQPQVPQVQAPTVQPVTGFTPQVTTPYTPQFNMNQGGIVPPVPTPSGNKFGGFKPEALQRIAQNLGYSGDMNGFDQYLNDNPDKKQKMDNYNTRARKMAEGGMVKKYAPGGDVTDSTTVSLQQYDPRVLNQQYIPQAGANTISGIGDLPKTQVSLATSPSLPMGTTIVPVGTQLDQGQLVSPYAGQVAGSLALPTALAGTEQAMMPTTGQAAMMSPVEASGAISAAAGQTQAAQLSQVSQIDAAQQQGTSVSNVQAAQGTGILMNNPVQRQIQDGELISGVANAETAAKFNEEIQAATATPTKQATVQGQLEGLMAQFEGGDTPAWAAGSMRSAMATLSARGLGASSLAGQAVIQAAMEAALPIAQIDAQTQAQFESQNLTNRQQRAMLAAQQRAQFLGQEFDQAFQSRVANAARVADIANMNFNAEQQIALENSRIANTMELTNLSNKQAMVMAEAAALANMDTANLNNRQQAAVQNAQNFLQADLTNLANAQQVELFKSQQIVQSLFTDQAAINAAQQFNATSQNQVDQFFASLQSNTAQFNAAQANAQAQFNAGQVNTIERFNAEINNQRDQFNAQNQLIIDQSNAQWRREIATADTAAVNRANELNALQTLEISNTAYNNLWQMYSDQMKFAFEASENEAQRINNLAVQQLINESKEDLQSQQNDFNSSAGFGAAIVKVLTSDLSGSILGGWL